MADDEPQSKLVRWIGSSRDDLREFPEEVRLRVGGALWEAQLGRKAGWAKPLKGFGGASVLEVVDDFDGDTFRAVYTVRFAGVVYVLHAFQNICAPRLPEEVEERHRDAAPRDRADRTEAQTGERGLRSMAGRREDEILVSEGSGNLFADLQVADPEEELAKAQLAGLIRDAIKRRRLTQGQAADVTGLDQPKVSALVNGRLGGFSSDRLLRCLTALGQDVEIVVRRRTRPRARGRLRVVEKAA